MLDTCDVIAFVSTAQPEAARLFYGDVLGLPLVADEPVALVFDAHGTMLRVAKVPAVTPARSTVLGWKVSDIESVVDILAGRGVAFARFPGFDQDERGIWTSPATAKVAWFADPDGNTLSLTQF